MATDFFGGGVKKDDGIQFSKEENAFFQSKLMLLDPQKTKQVPLGKVLWLLTLANIRSDNKQKIIKSCKLESGKKTFTYDDVKKVFRAIALTQNQMEPSTINITTNIRTKMPIFYDDEESDQEEGPPPPTKPSQQAPPSPPPQQSIQSRPQPSPKQSEDFFQKPVKDVQKPQPPKVADKKTDMFDQFLPSPKQPVAKPVPQPSRPSVAPQQIKQSPLTIKLRQFQTRWQKLKVEDNKIDGGQVKTLCKNFSQVQRSGLAKAWKLCCNTHSKCLTKGEFFVFLQLVASPQIPEALTPQMKNCIAMIDKVQPQKDHSEKAHHHPVHTEPHLPQQPHGHQAQSAQSNSPKPPNKMATSQLFQNFGKAQVSIVQTYRQTAKTESDHRNIQRVQKLSSQASQVSKNELQSSADMIEIKRSQQSMNNVLGQLQQYLTKTKDNSHSLKEQFVQLKQSQQILNERLNRACYFINQIVKGQNGLIEQLANDYVTQNNINAQRVANLEKYVTDLSEELKQKDIIIRKITNRTSPSEQQQPTQAVAPPTLSPKQQQPIEHFKQAQDPIVKPAQSQLQHVKQPEQQRSPSTFRQEESQTVRDEVQGARQTQVIREGCQQRPPQQQSSQQEQKKEADEAQHQQRIRNLQIQIFQLLRYIKYIPPEEEPKLIEYIKQWSEQQLNQAYVQCYQQFQAKQREEQAEAQRVAQSRTSHQDDEFRSSNFKGQPQPPQQDMFG